MKKMFLKANGKILMVGLFGLLGLCGCERVRETLGMNQSAPDEFSEHPFSGDLAIPPSFDLLPKPKSDGKETPPFVASCPVQDFSLSEKPQTPAQSALLKKLHQEDDSQDRQKAL
jgi:hypothetical protein